MSSAPMLSRVQKKGQVTIPSVIRQRLGLKEGDLVAFTETPSGVLIAPQEVVAMELLDRIGEALQTQGITLEDLITSGREIRGAIVEEKYRLSEDA
jgi:AbrB family looped-hinge helix DNA binding protein